MEFLQSYLYIFRAVFVLCIAIALHFFIRIFLRKLDKFSKKREKIWQRALIKALEYPLLCYIWFAAFFIGLRFVFREQFPELLGMLNLIFKAGTVIFTAWFLFRWKNFIVTNLKSRPKEYSYQGNKIEGVSKLMTLVILFLTVLVLLEVSGQSIQTLIAFGGIGGIAIAFASQEIISNFFGGFMIYFNHPFDIGDWIQLPEKNIEGHIEEIGWYMTRIRDFDKRPFYVPNSLFTKAVVVTPSRMTNRRFREVFCVRYSDFEQVPKITAAIKEMLNNHPAIDRKFSSNAVFDKFADSGLNINVRAYTKSPNGEEFEKTKEDLLYQIYAIIESYGAEMAYPTYLIEMVNQKSN